VLVEPDLDPLTADGHVGVVADVAGFMFHNLAAGADSVRQRRASIRLPRSIRVAASSIEPAATVHIAG
jgi:hypothetical protein